MHYINRFLGKHPMHAPLRDAQLPHRLAAWWQHTFLEGVFGLLTSQERDALHLLSVHGEVFDPKFVQLLLNLPTLDEAISVMVGWEALSLVYFVDTDEDDNPWYVVPSLIETAITTQMSPDALLKAHKEVARVMQHEFFLRVQERYEKLKGPKPDANNEFKSILTDISVVAPRLSSAATHRYLDTIYTWYQHFREMGEHETANEVASVMLPALWTLRHLALGKKLTAQLLETSNGQGPQAAVAYLWQATYALEEDDTKKALESLQTAEKLVQSHEVTSLIPQVLERRGFIFRQQGQYVLAMNRWEAALKHYLTSKNTRGIVQCLLYMAEAAYFQGELPQAKDHVEKALKRLDETEEHDRDVRLRARLFIYRGHIARQAKHDAEALASYGQALTIGKAVSDGFIIGKALEGTGYIYGLLKQYDIAARYLLQAVDVFEKIDDKRSLVVAQSRLAQVYDYKGSSKDAQIFCERALQLAIQHSPAAVRQTEDLLKQLKSKWRRLIR
jgi:tetratricopeptide (TPR) repeat protein